MHRFGFGISLLLLAATATPVLAATDSPEAVLEQLVLAPASAADVAAMCDRRIAAVESARQRLEAMPVSADPIALLRAYDDVYNLAQHAAYAEAHLLQQTHPDAEVRKASADCGALVSSVVTRLAMSRPVFERLQAANTPALPAGLRYMVERQIENYRRSGVDQDEATRARIAALQDALTVASQQFSKNIADDIRFIEVKPAQLAGLPADFVAEYPAGANGLVRIPVTGAQLSPVMQYASDAGLRERMLADFLDRGHPANDAVLADILAKRAELATLLGYPDYAAYDFANRMAKDPQRVRAFIDRIDAAARPTAQAEAARLLARLQRDDATMTTLASSDVVRARELLREEEYGVDAARVRQYFDYDKVKQGIFDLTADLFGVSVRPWVGAPTWSSGVEAWEMVENGEVIGRFYLDMHPRDGKFTHAAMFPVRIGVKERIVPVAALVTNFPDGLMEHGQVEVFLHEFGHLLHWMFAGQVDWAMQNFGEIENDVIEAPSTLLEEWVWDYDTLKRFATNAAGEPIPQQLVEKMNDARRFGVALRTMDQLGLAAVALDYYSRDMAGVDLTEAFYAAFERHSLATDPEGIHPQASFGHLTGYGASYYTYQWSEALASDLLSRFRTAGLRDATTARAYREKILAPGGSASMNLLARDFLGRDWSVDAYRAELERGEDLRPASANPAPAVPADAAATRAAFEAYLIAFWSEGDTTALARALAPTMTYHYNGERATATAEDHLQSLQAWRGFFPDLTAELDVYTGEGAYGAASTTWRGGFEGSLCGAQGTGQRASWSVNYVFRVEDGRIVEMWETWNQDGLLQKLGIPASQCG